MPETSPARLTVTVEEAARLLGIGRNKAYQIVHDGMLPALRVGRRLVVPRSGLERLLAGPGNIGAIEKENS